MDTGIQNTSIFDLIPLIPKVTSVEDYVPYRHTRLFLKTKYRDVPQNGRGTPGDIEQWLAIFHRTNKTKFLRRLHSWIDLEGKIPMKFMDLLGISGEDLFWILDFDKEDYHEALKCATRPKYFQYRAMPCVYPVVPLPADISEEDAVIYVREFMKGKPDYVRKVAACILYGGIKSVWVTEGNSGVDTYEPEIVIEKDFVFLKQGDRPFSVRLG